MSSGSIPQNRANRSTGETRRQVVRRRTGSIGGVALGAIVLTIGFLPLVALAVLVDLVRLRTRLPLARLVAFGWCWCWLELAGVAAAAVLWVTGRARDGEAHRRLQRWWSRRLMSALGRTCGLEVEILGLEALADPPVVVLVRHASLADSLLTAWVVADRARLAPRVVLKHELLADPCLDVVGNRLPNCFVDRDAADSAPALAAISELGATMDPDSATIIFPEGTRANPSKRRRALERIAASDPVRADRLSGLRHLLPPRPAGTAALLDGAGRVGASVVLGCHVGFDGMDTFAGIMEELARGPVRVRVEFVRADPPPRVDPADPAAVARWLDDRWLELDARVEALGATG